MNNHLLSPFPCVAGERSTTIVGGREGIKKTRKVACYLQRAAASRDLAIITIFSWP